MSQELQSCARSGSTPRTDNERKHPALCHTCGQLQSSEPAQGPHGEPPEMVGTLGRGGARRGWARLSISQAVVPNATILWSSDVHRTSVWSHGDRYLQGAV